MEIIELRRESVGISCISFDLGFGVKGSGGVGLGEVVFGKWWKSRRRLVLWRGRVQNAKAKTRPKKEGARDAKTPSIAPTPPPSKNYQTRIITHCTFSQNPPKIRKKDPKKPKKNFTFFTATSQKLATHYKPTPESFTRDFSGENVLI